MPARGLAAVLLVALVLTACGADSSNPFANGTASRAPSSAMAILFVSSSWATEPGQPRELLAIDAAGTSMERLTSCASAATPCDFVQVAPAPDRNRVAAIRTLVGSEPDAKALYFMDLSRSVETILQAQRRVSFVDWSSDNSFLLYTSTDAGGLEDIFFSNITGASEQNLTTTTDVRERQPRIDPGARTAVFEHLDATGVSRIYIYQATPVTTGEAPGPVLPGTPYLVGADADPAWSPDATSIVFRRLTAVGNGGLGTWDLMTVKNDGTGLQTIATGPLFRGGADWGKAGIVFVETDVAAAESRLVLLQPDGTGRKVLRTEPMAYNMGAPRFLYGQ